MSYMAVTVTTQTPSSKATRSRSARTSTTRIQSGPTTRTYTTEAFNLEEMATDKMQVGTHALMFKSVH